MQVILGVYRVIVATIYLAVFGLGALFISVIFFNLLSLVIRDKQKKVRISRTFTSASFRMYLKSGELIGIFKFNFHHLDKLKNDQKVIYIANHPSLLDFVILTAIGKNTSCVVKSSLKKRKPLSS